MLKITSKKEITIYLILMLIYLTVAFSYGKLAFNEKYTERSLTSLEQVMGHESTISVGNDYGMIYSIDGKPISAKYDNVFCAVDGYSEIVGCESVGIIHELSPILLSNDSKSNRTVRQGNNIVTTLSSKGMKTAHEMLADYNSQDIRASICVVLADGAVLVDAGNNTYASDAFKNPDNYNDIFCNYNSMPELKGSSFKPVIYRMLLTHKNELSDEFNFVDGEFQDISEFRIGDRTICNWDHDYPGNYDGSIGDVLQRKCTLADLLKFSSNTAPLRICNSIGFDKAYKYLNDDFQIKSPLVTEVNKLIAVTPSEDEMVDYFFGQGANISSLRMCQLFNYLVSGEFTVPFYCASVIQPDGKVLYKAKPKPIDKYKLQIDVENDILNNALEDTFESYITPNLRQKFPDKLLSSRRILAKSGTAELGNGNDNRVLMMTVMNKERTNVICSACIAINNISPNTITNEVLIEKLLYTLSTIGII